MANSKNVDIYMVEESTYGTTPTNPNWTYVRRVDGSSLGIDKNTFVSNEMRSDSDIPGIRHGQKQVGATIPFELSYGTFDKLLQGAMRGTWAGNTPTAGKDQLKGGNTRRSFSILAFFSDMGAGTNRYHLYKGCEVTSLSLSFPAEGIITGSFAFFGQDKSNLTTAPSGSVFGPSNDNEPMTAKGGTIKEGNNNSTIVTEVSFSLENSIEGKYTWGSDISLQPGAGRRNVTLNLAAYFEDPALSLLLKYENEIESKIEFEISDPDNNKYKFIFPAIKYTGGRPEISGTSIPITLPAQAYRDSVYGSSMVIERDPA